MSTQIRDKTAAADIRVGASQAYVREALGKPQKEGSIAEFEYYNYCILGLRDEMYEFVFKDGVLVWDERYLNEKSGPCEDFFRPINVKGIRSAIEAGRLAGIDRTVYNIDTLRITTIAQNSEVCGSGAITKILLEGVISPDSSFALERVLGRLKPCKSSSGSVLVPVTVSLRSGGGLLADGYKMGETLRKFFVTTVIENENVCASSCAVAYLGGGKRVIENKGQIMFHAPYFEGRNEAGKRDINCEVGDKALAELLLYYKSMTDAETGERLFERTMWYCSADDGWVVTGGAAAELYGISTER